MKLERLKHECLPARTCRRETDKNATSVRIAPLNMSFQARTQSLDSVAQAVAKQVLSNSGNHLAYCASLSYLDQLHQKLTALDLASVPQRAIINGSERKLFLARFTSGPGSVGLAVMGGLFAEGIDLPGEQLIGDGDGGWAARTIN
jgi:DNA excision repair protein ERCC-2